MTFLKVLKVLNDFVGYRSTKKEEPHPNRCGSSFQQPLTLHTGNVVAFGGK